MPADKTICHLSAKRKTKQHRFSCARNRIAITFLFCLGLRANELFQINGRLIKEALAHGKIMLFQPKTNQYRVVVCTKALRDILENELCLDIQLVFTNENDLLISNSKNRNIALTPKSWLRCLNNFINIARVHFNMRPLSTHSFRINYITSLLRTVPIQQVKTIIGHKNIDTTSKYDRYIVNANTIELNLSYIQSQP
jgi:site-specific recombinase XerD